MKFQYWKTCAELLGIAAVVASLIFVGLELQQTWAIAESQGNAGALANSFEESSAIMEREPRRR